ncbi:MAG: hypothetical protein JSV86_04890 [Gemmatimonadota bacterium]|nr:MAG: hypothetical protein JSV86_04890 [Gemmatimonadota bacterium]
MGTHADHRPDLGAPNGIATLDANSHVPIPQLPPSVQALIASTPGEYVGLGSRITYIGEGNPEQSEIQLVRALLPAATYDRMRVFVRSLSGGTKTIRLGVYNDSSQLPTTQVEQTPATDLVAGLNTIALETPFTILASGYYWLALILSWSGQAPGFASTIVDAPAGFLPVRTVAGTGSTLPSPVVGTVATEGAVIYRAVLESGAP